MLSIIITSRNEGCEVLWTCENARMYAGCEHEIIMVDDASTDHSADNLPGFVQVVKRTKADNLGVAPARMAGIRVAQGDCFMFLDAHMRVAPKTPARLYEKAMEVGGCVTSPMRNLYGSDRTFWNRSLKINKGKGRIGSDWGKRAHGMERIHAFVAPGYAISRAAFERIGGWPCLAHGWGQTEVCLSVKLLLADLPIYIMGEAGVLTWHLFRAGETTDPIPYSISGYDPVRNNYVMCRTCFEPETLDEFWLPLMKQGHHWKKSFAIWSDEAEREREAFRAVKKLEDGEFFEKVLGMTYEQAKEKYLAPENAETT